MVHFFILCLFGMACAVPLQFLSHTHTPPPDGYGPGKGPWQVGRPEDYGLSQSAITASEEAVNSALQSRHCYLVIKKGVIVYEKYRGNGGANVPFQAYSATKSMCGSLYGIAVEQGWANVDDKVRDKNWWTRGCNKNATFENVLTMTGESSNISEPTFGYDAIGFSCLDAISDFISQNNPQELYTVDWKNRFWHDVLGLESMDWSGFPLPCGFGAMTSCRDLARVAQLYLNDGAWPGAGQVMNKEYTQKSRTMIFPSTGKKYGYTVWLGGSSDPVDPTMSSFNGLFGQCALMSKKHEALIISMGRDFQDSAPCETVWKKSRDSIAGEDHAILSTDVRQVYNTTSEEVDFEEAIGQNRADIADEEILTMGKYMLSHRDQFDADDINSYIEWSAKRV